MALRALITRRNLDLKRKQLDALRAKDADFQKRETELETAIGEAETEEDQTAVEEEVAKFDGEKAEHEAEKTKLTGEIEQLEAELKETERAAPAVPAERKDEKTNMSVRDVTVQDKRSIFYGMDHEQRNSFLAREDIKEFAQRARELMKEKRAISGVELTIPEVYLGLLREKITYYSKLMSKVNLRRIRGKSRTNVLGTVPEAIWTEQCAKLNELDIAFYNMELDGYKIGGYFAICNAVIEDSDLNLLSELATTLGQAMGIGIDKAILYGTGTKMPLGIVTRLAEPAEPSDYPAKARPWADLSASNILTITTSKHGADFYKEMLTDTSAAKGKYSTGGKFWAMNEKTFNLLKTEALTINAAGAIVTGQSNTMPIVGGDIVVLDFIPDNNIVGGYGDLYTLVERAGASISTSEHFRFLDDQTVIKGTARYDGAPAIAEGFVVIGIAGTTPAETVTFPTDTANP